MDDSAGHHPSGHRRADGARGRRGGGGHRKGKTGVAGVLRDIGYVSFGKYGQYVITVVTLPLIARQLGTHGVGLLAIGMSAYFIGSLAVDLGITSFLAAKVHDARAETDIDRLRGTYLAIRATTLSTIGLALLGGLAIGVPPPLHMILLGLFAGGVWSISEDWLLIGQGRFGASTLYQGAGRIGYLVLLVVLLPRYPTASTALLCLLLSSLLTVALTWWDAWRTFGIPGRPQHVRRVLRIGAPMLTSRALVTSYGQGSAAVYAAVLNAASLGLYSAGDRLVRAIQSLLDPIGFALLPRMARRSTDESFWRSSVRSLAACVAVAVVAVLAVWVTAPLVVHIMFGSAFDGAVPLLRVEALILPATTVTSFVTTAVLPVRQDTAGVLIGAVAGTCVAAVALGIAMQTHSVWTLVYGTVCAEIAVALWYLVRMRWLVLRERGARSTRPPIATAAYEGGLS
ncbi:lipopolysaccharide biosynthesis protein [Nocardia transvalensis]|uniref:lipopolysaccharide biosynthesis protein n=1 Tax=Nocardia transvalensis TaxID=37333 RepID=UPI0018930A74|nr:lipopolysaccharide biosynthesis protein [Nocardia transvalensis]MBF6327873.1 lipopolysaccharide biosynthesis protein [Nocardia transvalensis]